MVNKDLLEAIDSGNEPKLGLAVYFTFLHRLDQCFAALCECAEGCGKEHAMSIVKNAFSKAKTDVELELRETLLYLAKRRKGE